MNEVYLSYRNYNPLLLISVSLTSNILTKPFFGQCTAWLLGGMQCSRQPTCIEYLHINFGRENT